MVIIESRYSILQKIIYTINLNNFTFFIFLFFAQIAFGQTTDFNRVIPPEGQSPRLFEDQLVQWAWYNSPSNQIYKQQLEIAAKRKNLTWWELLDASATFNLNEIHLSGDASSSNNLFFPKYNFGLSLNIGAIAAQPTRKKIAEAEMKIIELEEQQQMIKVRADVLQRYQDYELAVEILRSKTQAAEEAESVYTLVLEQFENDKADFKDFTAASTSFHGANESKAIAQTEVNKAKIALEELIGFSWDKAVKRRRKK